MNVTEAEWSLMQKRMEDREFEAYSGAWSMPWESDPYQIWHSSQADQAQSSNRIGFRNKEADALIEELRRTFEKEDRIKLYHRIHRILFEEQPYTFFYSPKSVFAWWDRVKRVEFSEVRPHDNILPWYLQDGEAP
jgi:ABC-type transport system substrate-binding protein